MRANSLFGDVWGEGTVWKSVIAISALLAVWMPASIGQQQKAPDKTEFKVPPEIAKQANPVKPTAALLAQAKKTYGIDCAMCHGKDGDGKGDLAADMKLQLPDYRDPAALKDKTDGELFYAIQKGKGDMPGEGDRVKPDEIWSLVNYIHSLAKKDAPVKDKAPGP
jgi:mono/diheme cytochrome c family protein